MIKTLYQYQKNGIEGILTKFRQGAKRVVFQLPTGGGKTLTASSLINAFHKNNPEKEIIFFVHRIELLKQFKDTYEKQYPNSEVGIIDAKCKMKRFDLKINVAMIDTATNRLKKNVNFFGSNIGLMVIDECHNAGFDKIFKYFPNTLTVGLTATPYRLSKKNPMRLVYDDIVSTVSIKELIEFGSLSPNKTFGIDNKVNFSQIKKHAGDYQKSAIFEEYSKAKHISNVVKVYEQKSKGKKTIIFNASIEHSELVNKAFNANGYKSVHLDGITDKKEREQALKWFAKTPGAILQNMGLFTMGFDEPSIQTVIMNRPTLSLPLWLQCTGRGSRIYPGKEFFTIIDLGGNADRLGDWSRVRDWNNIFHNAEFDPTEGDGIAPTKTCPECSFMMAIQSMECPECGYKFTKEIEEEETEIELKLVVDNFSEKVNIHKIDKFISKRNWNDYSGLHIIKDVLIRQVKNEKIPVPSLRFNRLKTAYFEEVQNWCKLKDKKFNGFIENFAEKILYQDLEK